MTLTRPQIVSLHRKWQQCPSGLTFLSFRRACMPHFFGDGTICVPWAYTLLRIERDGETSFPATDANKPGPRHNYNRARKH